MKKEFFLIAMTAITQLIVLHTVASQSSPDSCEYPPQVRIVASNGFKPFIIGIPNEVTYTISELPQQTSSVVFQFVDVEKTVFGPSYTETGSSLSSVSWQVDLNSFAIPLSSSLQINITWKTDSLASYSIPLSNLPDTLHMTATKGWGPFITNTYPLNDSLWQPVPPLENTFVVKNLPPETSELRLRLLAKDTTVIDSFVYVSLPGQYLDSIELTGRRMDQLPLSTAFLEPVAWCNGGPGNGLSLTRNLNIASQPPHLICISEEGSGIDTVFPTIQHQSGGHALLIDSVKRVVITNKPGANPVYQLYGTYTFPLVFTSFSIEAWIKPAVSRIQHSTSGEMTFMKADKAWFLSLKKTSDGKLKFHIYTRAYNERFDVFTAEINHSAFLDTLWHYMAVSVTSSSSTYGIHSQFYLDGKPIPTTVDYQKLLTLYEYITTHQYDTAYNALPLVIGGVNAQNDKGSNDRTYLTEIDGVRIWNRPLSHDSILQIMSRPVLQEPTLVGYWDFDDLNNRLDYISDLSYQNNSGMLYEGAILTPQNPQVESILDTLTLISSNLQTNSVRFSFIDDRKSICNSTTCSSPGGVATARIDLSSLPWTVTHLKINEFMPGAPDTGFTTTYPMRIHPPLPEATARNGWATYFFRSDAGNPFIGNSGKMFNAVTVNGFPAKTRRVILGLEKNGVISDTLSYTTSSNPYQHSLSLDGKGNFIQIPQAVTPPEECTIMLWFKTTSSHGGCLAMLSENASGGAGNRVNYMIAVKEDGSLLYNLLYNNTSVSLHGTSQYNDGDWHHVAAMSPLSGQGIARLYVDGSIVDEQSISGVDQFNGYWTFGKSYDTIPALTRDMVAEYFQGSLTEISIWNAVLEYTEINQLMYLPSQNLADNRLLAYYKLNEGSGTMINDSKGNHNGTFFGDGRKWFTAKSLDYTTWSHNMIDLEPGIYTFFTRFFFEYGPDTGVVYPIGRFQVIDPIPGSNLTYNISLGTGYFDAGTNLTNRVSLWTDVQIPNALAYQLKYQFLTPSGTILQNGGTDYIQSPLSISFDLNMGLVPPGSYLVIYLNYMDINAYHSFSRLTFPMLIRNIAPPKVSGDFGPFIQAIAPETMVDSNTFIISTAVINELSRVKARFYDIKGDEIGSKDVTRINTTTWKLTYDMASLSPPFTSMKLEYYLQNESFPLYVQGPIDILITRTRPVWFDFLKPDAFSDITETNSSVAFTIKTPFLDKRFFDTSFELTIPDEVPLLGGSGCEIMSPCGYTYLVYYKEPMNLDFQKPPKFYNKFFHLGSSKSKILSLDFNTTQYNNYSIDSNNILFATQNLATTGSVSTGLDKIIDLANEIKTLVDVAGAINPESAIISPSFNLSCSGSFEYSARLNLMIDSTTGSWGSKGNLNVTANHHHANAYKNSASYHFYAGRFGLEFGIGAKLFEGLAEGDFCVDLSFRLGGGYSYVTLPKADKKFLKDFGMDIYGKFIVKELWGLTEQTVWGPKHFYSKRFWGDDMDDVFPPPSLVETDEPAIPAKSSLNALVSDIIPISGFGKIPLAYPQAAIIQSTDYQLFTWLERGHGFGERKLQARFLRNNTKHFSPYMTVESNNHILNNPVAAGISDDLAILTWAQNTQTSSSLTKINKSHLVKDFLEQQDIWFAVFDLEQDSILQMNSITGNKEGISSVVAEANPRLTMLSETEALVVWQVADLETHKSDIYYSTITKQVTHWTATTPKLAFEIQGIETHLELVSPEHGKALLVFLNHPVTNQLENRIMMAEFLGTNWGAPGILINDPNSYYNYLDLKFNGTHGGLVVAEFTNCGDTAHYESLSLFIWKKLQNTWILIPMHTLLADSVGHIQYPSITIFPDGSTTVACKRETFAIKEADQRISQIDLFKGNITNPSVPWIHLEANPAVCDTTKQVSGISISYIGPDTLMLLTQEFVMLPANTPYVPSHGITWGDPYMNQVLRCFAFHNDSILVNIPEKDYTIGLEEPVPPGSELRLYQNYPNPASNQTTIRFDLPFSTMAKLELFTMKGIRIATLADQQLPAGDYKIQLNTSILDPGMYIYKLTTSRGEWSLRMVVIR